MTDIAQSRLRSYGVTAWPVIFAVSAGHLLNDVMQSLLAAIYPMLKTDFALDYWQIGLLTLAFQVTAALLQPVVGIYTDRRAQPWSLPFGMAATLAGLLLLAVAPSYGLLIGGAALIGIGSSIFHPEASRVARMASGGRYGTAQSIFQVGGNFGTSIGPLLAAFIVLPLGRPSVAWFSLAAFLGILILTGVSRWYAAQTRLPRRAAGPAATQLPRAETRRAVLVLLALIFSKYLYLASMTSYYTFYLIHDFGLGTQDAQLMLFVFLGALAVGTVIGGPIGDRIGTRTVIWVSILGVLPFTLLLPHANLAWTGALTVVIGVTLASAFPAIVVFAQQLLPGRVGMVSGLFFGFAFGMGGIGAAVIGLVADAKGIDFVFDICAWLPALGILAVLLPDPARFEAAGTPA